MKTILLAAAMTAASLCSATCAFAQARDANPMGLDYGPFHPAVPAQVTTYYPPEPAAPAPRAHRRLRRPIY